MGPRFVATVVLVSVLAPAAMGAAATDGFSLTSAAPPRIEGTLSALTMEGMAKTTFDGTTGTAGGVTGIFTVWTWNETILASQRIHRDDAAPHQIPVQNATLTLEPVGLGTVTLQSHGGTISASGRIEGAFAPKRLHATYNEAPGSSTVPEQYEWAPNLVIEYQADWLLAGALRTPPVSGFPRESPTRLVVAGDVEIEFADALWVNFTNEDGTSYAQLMGPRAADSLGNAMAQKIFFQGFVGHASIPLTDHWSLSGPDLSFTMDAKLEWAKATGWIQTHGQRRNLEGSSATLTLRGIARPGDAAILANTVQGEGTVENVVVDGRSVASGLASAAAPAAVAITALALVAIFLTKWGQALIGSGVTSLYTRLTPADLLLHPQRQRIMQILDDQPGIHQRELHREAGGAWGAFSFHFRMLQKAGHLRVAKQGGYTLVFGASASLSSANVVVIPHPLARAAYDALPHDGSPVPLAELSASLGESRELVSYHLRALEARGLVKRVPLDGQRKGVVRVVQATA